MAKRKARKKKRTKESRLNNMVYDYHYLYKELFGDEKTIFDFSVKGKRLSLPTGKLRAFIRTLNKLLDYGDEKNKKAGRKLWQGSLVKDSEYDIRTVKYRRKLKHYALFEYINRAYKTNITDNLIVILSERLDMPYYLLKNTYNSWKGYMHEKMKDPKDKKYMSMKKLKNELGLVILAELDKLLSNTAGETKIS